MRSHTTLSLFLGALTLACLPACEASLAARTPAEARLPAPTADDADFMLHLLRRYDRNFRYWIDAANVGNRATLDLLLEENALPGFSDSGAHITNMSFFDANLMALKLAQQRSLQTVATMVRRLTSEPAAFFGLDVGNLAIGAQADITMIDPKALAAWDDNANRRLEYRDIFQHQQMVSRSDGVVTRVLINGEVAWDWDQIKDSRNFRD